MIAAAHGVEQVIDVNGIGVNFTLVNVVEVAGDNRTDDQGKHTDPMRSLDYAVSTKTYTAIDDDALVQPISSLARAAAQAGEATQLFQTPNMPIAPTTDSSRPRSGDEALVPAHLNAKLRCATGVWFLVRGLQQRVHPADDACRQLLLVLGKRSRDGSYAPWRLARAKPLLRLSKESYCMDYP
eukprot:6177121-Pleurochrysis_carterae.AAC.2